jgi:hypothetical protein
VISSKSSTSNSAALAVNARGDAVLAWAHEPHSEQGRGPIRAVTRPAGGRFGRQPVTLAGQSYPAIVAIDPRGNATALFDRARGPHGEEESSTLETVTRPVDGSWSKPAVLAAEGEGDVLAYGPAGALTAVWSTRLSPSGQPLQHSVIETSILPAGGAWRPPEAISPENSSAADLALAPNGQATAIWLFRPLHGREVLETADYGSSTLEPG